MANKTPSITYIHVAVGRRRAKIPYDAKYNIGTIIKMAHERTRTTVVPGKVYRAYPVGSDKAISGTANINKAGLHRDGAGDIYLEVREKGKKNG